MPWEEICKKENQDDSKYQIVSDGLKDVLGFVSGAACGGDC
jgi:hypothetical protein